jgi:hypothetical protein
MRVISRLVRSESEFGGGGGGLVFFAKKEGTPPTLSSEALLSKKIDENGKNSAKIVQNRS